MDALARIVTWNIAWSTAATPRGRELLARIAAAAADVLVLTEATAGFPPPGGHVVSSSPDYGYASAPPSRRKVILWSRNPWADVDDVGEVGLPGGRFVAATTSTPLGALRLVGVCIPWREAHVSTGRKDRRPWQDHLTFLAGLRGVLAREAAAWPRLVLVGDLNQSLPRTRAPRRAAEALADALGAGRLRAVTAGRADDAGRHLVDHIAIGPSLAAVAVRALNATWGKPDGAAKLSDHAGVEASLVSEKGALSPCDPFACSPPRAASPASPPPPPA